MWLPLLAYGQCIWFALIACHLQLNQDERLQAISASEKLNNMILSIEDSMSWVCKRIPTLEREQTFGGLGTRIALIKQAVVQYRDALYSSAVYNEHMLDST